MNGTIKTVIDVTTPRYEALLLKHIPKELLSQRELMMLPFPEKWRNTLGEGVRVGLVGTGWPDHHDVEANVRGKRDWPHWRDRDGHSTFVAGLIGADGRHGAPGIAPHTNLYCARAVPGSWADCARVIEFLCVRQIEVVCLQFGGHSEPPPFFCRTIERWASQGVTFIAPASYEWPAKCNGVMAVDSKSGGSSMCAGISINCGSITSTWLAHEYATLSGDSVAAAVATGLVALILGMHQGTKSLPRTSVKRIAVCEYLLSAISDLRDTDILSVTKAGA